MDTVIGQLIAVLHGKHPRHEQAKLEATVLPTHDGFSKPVIKNLPLRTIIYRWVRCFHAALYGNYLTDRGGMIFEPFPTADDVDGRLVTRKSPKDRPFLTQLFRQQVKAGRVDSIICYNEKCHYRCCWLNTDDGQPLCLWALRLYNWEDLGDPDHPKRGCLGWYWSDIPDNAIRATDIEIPTSSFRPLDPFAPS